MFSNPRFWIFMALFQVTFGLAVFAATRHFYLQDPDAVAAVPANSNTVQREWPENSQASDLEQLITSVPGPSNTTDPWVLADQADEAFGNQQYEQAADLYHQLLMADPNNVDTYNNLGITLHYLGRSAQALGVLNEGVTIDPGYQRIWLTLGFVNSQAGNIDEARSALDTAVELDSDNEVGQSALKMLEALGPGQAGNPNP